MAYRCSRILILSLFFWCHLANAALLDHEINVNVIYQLARHPQTHRLNLEVVTNHGIVKLSGVVETCAQAAAAIELTARTTGVRGIDTSDLTLPYGKPIPRDIVILAKIRGILLRENIFPNYDDIPICIVVEDGVVYVSGIVDTHEQVYAIRGYIHDVRGVQAIHSTLRVRCPHGVGGLFS